MNKLIDVLRNANAMKEFKAVVDELKDSCVHDLLRANDNNAMHAIRGQISICTTFADSVSAALQADEAKAKAKSAEGIPQ